MTTYMIHSTHGKEFAFEAKDEAEARKLVNRWATKHSHCGSAYNLEDMTGQDTTLLHNEYVR